MVRGVIAVAVGLLMSIFLASVGYANDTWFFFSYIGGDLVPIHAFGLLLLGLLLINPLLRLLRIPKFRGGDWAIMLSMMMAGSVLAGSGLFWAFPQQIIMPISDQTANAGWQQKDLLHYVPRPLMVERTYEQCAVDHGIQRAEADKTWRDAVARGLPEDRRDDVLRQLDAEYATLIKGYMEGLPNKEIAPPLDRLMPTGVPITDVPWKQWRSTLSFWMLLLSLTYVAGLAAVVIVHRQWADREHLAYPLVTFTNELIGQDEGGFFGAIFRNRIFWMGFALSFGVLLVNGLHSWYPNFVTIDTFVDFGPAREYFGALPKVPQSGGNILKPTLYFGAVGLAYFLTSEASFSLGISGWLYALAFAPLFVAGVDLNMTFLEGGLPSYMYFGAYLGMALMVLYLGRRFYLAVVKRGIGLKDRSGDVLPREVWAFRILLLASAAMLALLVWIGLHWLLALAFVALTGLVFLMVGRVHVATGLFMIQPLWHPVSILAALFGGFALGPHALVILAMLCVVVTFDTRICLIPLALNALKLGDSRRLKPGGLATWMGVAIVVSLVISVILTIWMLYGVGMNRTKSDGTNWALAVAKMPFEMLDRRIDALSATDRLAEAQQPTSVARLLGNVSPAPHFWAAVLAGMALVTACSWLRLRFPRWPLHPAIFLVWGTPWMTAYAPSFLLAWFAKELIMRYGGQSSYRRGRAFFVGLVAGEIAAALLWGVVGVAYYMQKGVVGPSHFLVRE